MANQVEIIKYTPEKAKQNALAKLDLIRKWQEFRRKAVNKLQADYDFVKLHNTSNSHFVVFFAFIKCWIIYYLNIDFLLKIV